MADRIDYLKLAFDYDVRMPEDAQTAIEMRTSMEQVKQCIGYMEGGVEIGKTYLKQGSQLFIEAWGQQADFIAKSMIFTIEGWTRLRPLRIDWRTERDAPIDTGVLNMIGKARGKVNVVENNSRQRSKKGDRDRGGQSCRAGSRKSDRSVIIYQIIGEKPAMEGNFRGKVAVSLWDEAKRHYRRILAGSEGNLEAAEKAMYDRLMDFGQVEVSKHAIKAWGFQVSDWWEWNEVPTAVNKGWNPIADVMRLVDALPGEQQQMVMDLLSDDGDNPDTRYYPA